MDQRRHLRTSPVVRTRSFWLLMERRPEDIPGVGYNLGYDRTQNRKANNYVWSGTFADC